MPTFAEIEMPIPQPPNLKGLPISEAISKMKGLEQTMTYEEFQTYKREQMKPFRTRNLALAGALWAGVIGVCKSDIFNLKHHQ